MLTESDARSTADDSLFPISLQNYFNYFTEIEEHFARRRGSLVLLSTLDWALIETWREAGVPLAAVLRGIDDAFDKHEARKTKGTARKVNGLAWAAQSVMVAVEEMKEAAVGGAPAKDAGPASGLESERIGAHLDSCARDFASASTKHPALREFATRLAELAQAMQSAPQKLQELERNLAVLEEKLIAVLLTTTPEADLLALREQAASELAPYRSRMQAVQIRQIEQQFLNKRLFERYRLPRISLFYMPQRD